MQGYEKGEEVLVGRSANYTNLSTWGWYSWTGWCPTTFSVTPVSEKPEEEMPFFITFEDAMGAEAWAQVEPPRREALVNAALSLDFRDGHAISRFKMDGRVPPDAMVFFRLAAAKDFDEVKFIVDNGGNNPYDDDAVPDPVKLELDYRAITLFGKFLQRAEMARNTTNFEVILLEKFGGSEATPSRVQSLVDVLRIELAIIRKQRYISDVIIARAKDRYEQALAMQRGPAAAVPSSESDLPNNDNTESPSPKEET